MSSFPSLTDLLQVIGSVGAVIGACIGFLLPAQKDRQMLENTALGVTLGGVIGVIVAFAIYAGIAVGGS